MFVRSSNFNFHLFLLGFFMIGFPEDALWVDNFRFFLFLEIEILIWLISLKNMHIFLPKVVVGPQTQDLSFPTPCSWSISSYEYLIVTSSSDFCRIFKIFLKLKKKNALSNGILILQTSRPWIPLEFIISMLNYVFICCLFCIFWICYLRRLTLS